MGCENVWNTWDSFYSLILLEWIQCVKVNKNKKCDKRNPFKLIEDGMSAGEGY